MGVSTDMKVTTDLEGTRTSNGPYRDGGKSQANERAREQLAKTGIKIIRGYLQGACLSSNSHRNLYLKTGKEKKSQKFCGTDDKKKYRAGREKTGGREGWSLSKRTAKHYSFRIYKEKKKKKIRS